jgi:hypothetical protein
MRAAGPRDLPCAVPSSAWGGPGAAYEDRVARPRRADEFLAHKYIMRERTIAELGLEVQKTA